MLQKTKGIFVKYLSSLFISFETICYGYPAHIGSGGSPKVMFFLFAIFSIIDAFRRLIKEDLQGAG